MHESHFALAPEGSRIVEALTVLAQSWVFGTFVDVLTDVSVSAESIVTGALQERKDLIEIHLNHFVFNLNELL